MWNYVFFVYYLDNKSPTDYSGLEYLITAQYNKSDEDMQIDWVPVAKAEEFDSSGKIEELSNMIDEKTEMMNTSAGEVEESLKKLKEILEG